ncbi:MAG: hypothetical protein COB85_09910 [Bacteroidetes bacterium]|nr:MAG: hypothetical protein COB85_09910 [Bacteroidota bacterium]
MNISDLLSVPEVKERFKGYTGLVTNHPAGEMLAPPISDRTGEVAIAFDYLLRFYTEHLNQDKKVEKNTWYAQGAFYFQYVQSPEEHLDFFLRLEREYEELIPIYKNYIKEGKVTKDLFYFCLFLAKFELSNKVPIDILVESYTKPHKESIKDLKSIFSLINPSHFLCDKKCYLNPTFGIGNMNADLIIDDTLIEIKTVSKIKWTDFKAYVNQLLVYYILSLIGQINSKVKRSPIKYLGIYYSRHGLYWREPIAEVLNTNKFFKEFFKKYPMDGSEHLIDYREFKSVKEIHKDPMVIEMKEWLMKYLPIEK